MIHQLAHVAAVVPVEDRALMFLLVVTTVITQAIRRRTWHVRWETGTTLTGALMCAALILLSPNLVAFNPFLPDALESGRVYPQVMAGYLVLMLAYGTFLYDLAGRMDWDESQKHRYITRRISLPTTIALPTAVGAWITGSHWLVFPMVLIGYVWLLSHICWLLWCIRTSDRRSHLVIDVYMVAFALCGLAWSSRYIVSLSITTNWGWRLATVGAILLMVGSTLSWRRKLRYMKAHMWRAVRRQKPLKRNAKATAPKQLDGAV
ncbi:hypothetical protein J4U00_gp038 [Mycobacterium phage DyoEdafos]|uniref:Uncharacterized protein n=1 Tax=Mycobacterium phage DyoEdafos TaxID=2599860 RepID=A0A5J6TKI1_9CAUD|nr:hypothetical protein J4U00_gp038 [Mycobacterium phage DyoEdafos]QFG10269.1 hypothetical protein SEA_DYOEDAFOS_38 [Mycobacterium phage DyoEdafos]